MRSRYVPQILCIVVLLTAVPALRGEAAGQGKADSPQSHFEEVTIPECDAVIYGWDAKGDLVLSLEDTTVFLGDWTLFPSLPPHVEVEVSAATLSRHETEAQAWELQWKLQKQGLPVDEIKTRVVSFLRASPLVESLEFVEGDRYKLQWVDESDITVLYIPDKLSRNPEEPTPEKPLEEQRRMARARFERWKIQLGDGNLVLFAHERTECFTRDEKELARAEIDAIRSRRMEPISEKTWGIEHLLSADMAAQIQIPLIRPAESHPAHFRDCNVESKGDSNRVLVFLPDRDVPPPYEVSGQVIDGRNFIYINGIQIVPNPSRPPRMAVRSLFDTQGEGARTIIRRMQAAGDEQMEIVNGVAEYFRDLPEVDHVEIDQMKLDIHYVGGRTIEYWCLPTSLDEEATLAANIGHYRDRLSKGYAYVFTPIRSYSIHPRHYTEFRKELELARGVGCRINEHEWKKISREMAESIRSIVERNSTGHQ